jgi:hypothetical protein
MLGNTMFDIRGYSKKYLDGDGNSLLSGGRMTEIFMESTKSFVPIEK